MSQQEDPDRDKLFDHEYDGIREYDNPMPRWWVWLFVITSLFAFPYVVYFHFGSGPSIHDRLQAEIAAFAEQLLQTYGELTPDESTLVQFMHDPNAMAGISGLFKGRCAQCHLADGSGNVGPNLTDDNWLNVKEITDIPKILTEGLIAKGMPAWADKLTETQIVLLSSYVASLRQGQLPGKPAQGEEIAPWPDLTAVQDEGEAAVR